MSLFKSIATATKDYANMKAEGYKDAYQVLKNYKKIKEENPQADVESTILIGAFDVEKYANIMKDVEYGSERLKTLRTTGNVVTACVASTIGCILFL